MSSLQLALVTLVSWTLTVLLVGPARAVELPPHWEPPEGMTSRCEDLLTPKRLRIANLWQEQQVLRTQEVLAKPEGESPIELDKKVRMTLLPNAQVSLVWPIYGERLGTHSGLVTFRSAGAGGYRFSSTPYVWLEIVPVGSDGKPMGVLTSDLRMGCSGMHKNIAFELDADTLYWVQMTGGRVTPETEFMITGPEPLE